MRPSNVGLKDREKNVAEWTCRGQRLTPVTHKYSALSVKRPPRLNG